MCYHGLTDVSEHRYEQPTQHFYLGLHCTSTCERSVLWEVAADLVLASVVNACVVPTCTMCVNNVSVAAASGLCAGSGAGRRGVRVRDGPERAAGPRAGPLAAAAAARAGAPHPCSTLMQPSTNPTDGQKKFCCCCCMWRVTARTLFGTRRQGVQVDARSTLPGLFTMSAGVWRQPFLQDAD